MTRIDSSEMVAQASVDRNGFVFAWKDRIFRAIYPPREAEIRELLDSGLIDELVQAGLFPKTTRTDYVTDDCALVLEHEKIAPVLLPENWSFEMHKDACLCLLEVNRIATHYGYATIDAHGFNILFAGNRPKFVDLGSFIKAEAAGKDTAKGWRGLQEFEQVLLLPLKIRASGWCFNLVPWYDSSFSALFKPLVAHPIWARLLPPGLYRLLFSAYYHYRMIHQVPDAVITDLLKYTWQRRLGAKAILWGKHWNILPFTSLSFARMKKQVQSIKKRRVRTMWGAYHDQVKSTPRFEKILELLRALPECKTVLEFGGNAGAFSKLLAENTAFERIICTDYDTDALDKLYSELRTESNGKIITALLNLRQDIRSCGYESGEQRLRSDITCCLALTHHLFLTQGLSLNFVFSRIRNYTTKYAAVEFMPLGLYSSKYNDAPALPDWYTEEWFRAGFERFFSTLSRTMTEKNRVLYVGAVKTL